MNEQDVLGYVRAAGAVMGIPLDEARAQRVAMHLTRTAALAAQLDACPFDVADEPAELYCPFPFPAEPAQQAQEQP